MLIEDRDDLKRKRVDDEAASDEEVIQLPDDVIALDNGTFAVLYSFKPPDDYEEKSVSERVAYLQEHAVACLTHAYIRLVTRQLPAGTSLEWIGPCSDLTCTDVGKMLRAVAVALENYYIVHGQQVYDPDNDLPPKILLRARRKPAIP